MLDDDERVHCAGAQVQRLVQADPGRVPRFVPIGDVEIVAVKRETKTGTRQV